MYRKVAEQVPVRQTYLSSIKADGLMTHDEIEWQSAGDSIRIVPKALAVRPGIAVRRRLFDLATERQRQRERERPLAPEQGARDWTREDLYDGRGSSR